jgi:hypothetical protein
MFAPRYFAASYFPGSYFAGGGTAAVAAPDPVVFARFTLVIVASA